MVTAVRKGSDKFGVSFQLTAVLADYLQSYCDDSPPDWRVRERYKQVLESQEEIGPAQVFYGRFCAQSSAAGQGAALPARREHAARLRSVGAKQKHYYYIKVATYIQALAGRCITTSSTDPPLEPLLALWESVQLARMISESVPGEKVCKDPL